MPIPANFLHLCFKVADRRAVLVASAFLDKKGSRMLQYNRSLSRQRLKMHRQATSGQNLVLVLCLLPALFMQIPRPRCMWTIDRYSSSERIILTMFCV